LAGQMMSHAMAAGVPFNWVAGDTVYGVGDIERDLRRAAKGYVLGVQSTHVFRSWGKPRRVDGTAAKVAEDLQPSDWKRLSAGEGTKGPRLHDWCYLELADLDAEQFNNDNHGRWTRGLLIRRHIADGDLAYFTTWCPAGTSIETLVKVEGHRWAIEDSFETAKNEFGLDHNETRSWHGWNRHVSLAMSTNFGPVGMRTRTWTTRRWFMYSYEDRVRAVELFIKLGKRVRATIRQLGYPTKNALKGWHREYEQRLSLPVGYAGRGPKYTQTQKEAAVEHYLTHDRCIAATMRALGYPGRGMLTTWVREALPEARKAIVGRAARPSYPEALKQARVIGLCSRQESARAVAEKLGVCRPTLYNWKNQLLGPEAPASIRKLNHGLPMSRQMPPPHRLRCSVTSGICNSSATS
jgi:transposase-like protein